MNKTLLYVVGGIVVVVVGGWLAFGGSGADKPTDGDVNVNTGRGGAKLADGWPSDAPIYAGALIQFSAMGSDADGSGGSTILYTSDSKDKVLAYYQQEIAVRGWTITGTVNVSGQEVISAEKADRILGVTIATASANTSGGSSITVVVGNK